MNVCLKTVIPDLFGSKDQRFYKNRKPDDPSGAEAVMLASAVEWPQIQMKLGLSAAHLLCGLVPNSLCMGTVLFCGLWIGDPWVI